MEITSPSVRLAAVAAGRTPAVLAVQSADLPPGMVSEDYASPSVRYPEGFAAILRGCLDALGLPALRSAAVSLPDGLFRVQTLEFDELPAKKAERERLIRWRLEKTAAFDMADALLRHQVMRRRDRGHVALACVAKRETVAQYEALLAGLGLEPWEIGLSSFHTVNFYSSYMAGKAAVSALACVSGSSFTTIVLEQGVPAFYRYKELKRGGAENAQSRLVREIDDSLHFYTHRDRSQSRAPDIGRLFLAGDSALLGLLAEDLASRLSLEVEVLAPASVLPAGGNGVPAGLPAVFSAALGAGGAL